jgi:hypothetical protein
MQYVTDAKKLPKNWIKDQGENAFLLVYLLLYKFIIYDIVSYKGYSGNVLTAQPTLPTLVLVAYQRYQPLAGYWLVGWLVCEHYVLQNFLLFEFTPSATNSHPERARFLATEAFVRI